jgi:hypothetical protein
MCRKSIQKTFFFPRKLVYRKPSAQLHTSKMGKKKIQNDKGRLLPKYEDQHAFTWKNQISHVLPAYGKNYEHPVKTRLHTLS